MTSSRPYLVRALNEWILDNNLTPYVVVDTSIKGVQVPEDFVSNGQIVLNISPGAVQSLCMGEESLEFSARFGGVPMSIYVPMMAIIAVYAKENGQGMVFGSEPGSPESPDDDETPSARSGSKSRPSLTVVK